MQTVIERPRKSRGVTCVHCARPIPLTVTMLQRETLLRRDPMNALRDWHSRVFSLRCGACRCESIYTLGHIHDFEEK